MIRRIILIALAVFCAHALLLLNDGLYSDAVIYFVHEAMGRWQLNIYEFVGAGRPQLAYFYHAFGGTALSIVAYRIVTMAALMASAVELFLIAARWLLRSRAMWFAIFAMVYPAYQTTTGNENSAYSVALAVFLLGALCAFRHEENQRIVWRVAALVCFASSFYIESLLAFFYGFVALQFVEWRARRAQTLTIMNALARFALNHADYLLLPIVYFVVVRIALFPMSVPLFIGYNTPNLANLLKIKTWLSFAYDELIYPFVWSLQTSNAAIVLVVMLIALPLSIKILREDAAGTTPIRKNISHILFVLLLIVLSFVPYVAVNKESWQHGVPTRFALLIGIPVALLIVTALELLFARKSQLYAIVALMLFASFCAAQAEQYLAWQAKWVKNRAIMTSLKTLSGIERISIIEPDDQWQPLAEERVGWYLMLYWPYEWSGLFRLALNSDKAPVVRYDLAEQTAHLPSGELQKALFFLDQYDPAGCQARLTIRRSDISATMGPFGLSRRYWYYRFIRPSEMDAFLRSLVTLQLMPINAPEATHCSR